jgi:hypothetical protein
LAHLAYNIAALSATAQAGKLRAFDYHFPTHERAEKPSLEDRIRDAWEHHGIEPPPGYEYLKKSR